MPTADLLSQLMMLAPSMENPRSISGCEACNGIPHVVGGAMAVDAVMSMVGVGLGDAVVEAVLPGWEAINAGGHAMEAHA